MDGTAAENDSGSGQEGGRLPATLSRISEAVVTTDRENRITFLNAVAEKLTGWSQDAIGEPLARVVRIVDEGSHDPVEFPTVQEFREGREAERLEHGMVVARDGTERAIEGHASPLPNAKGEVAGVELDFRDITERRATKRALEKSVRYARDIIATLREPFLVLDGDLRVDQANRAFYTAFEVHPAETENRLVFELGNGQWDIPGLRKLLEDVSTRNVPVEDYEVEHAFPHIGRRNMLLNARPFPPDALNPEAILLAIQDVTPQRESTLRERAEKLAEIDRRKDEFLATLAHELRNPLAPIRSGLEAIRLSGMEKGVVRKASQVMERQVIQMAHLVDDLLDVSRINRGEIVLRKERIDLASSLRHAVGSVHAYCEDLGVEVTVTVPSRAVHVNADPVRLEQVVGNLLTNACKFTDEGGQVFLTVEAQGAFAVIRVRDTGIGIAPEQLPQVFDLFMRGGTKMDRSERGLGIGLALVRHLVEKHGGTVDAQSAGLGQGSEFVVRLPVAEPLDKSLQDEATVEPSTPEPGSASGRILIVDDNRDAAQSLALLLGFAGYETHTAFGGAEAIEDVARLRPDGVVLDIGMPTVDGYEVCRSIRRGPGGEEIVVIAVSGWGHDEVRGEGREAGFDGHLVKPVEFAELRELLARLLPPGD